MLVRLPQPARQLAQLQQYGYQLLATHVRQGKSVHAHTFGPRGILVLGGEVGGIGAALLKSADEIITVPGSGRVESLNVSVAFGVIAGEYARQRGPQATARPAQHAAPRRRGVARPRRPRGRRAGGRGGGPRPRGRGGAGARGGGGGGRRGGAGRAGRRGRGG